MGGGFTHLKPHIQIKQSREEFWQICNGHHRARMEHPMNSEYDKCFSYGQIEEKRISGPASRVLKTLAILQTATSNSR